MPLKSAGSRPVIVGNSKEPRTRHPVAFTANCPHRDAGMKEPRYLRGRRKESGVERFRQGSAQAVRVRNVSGDFWGGGQLVSGEKMEGFWVVGKEGTAEGKDMI